MGAITDIKYRQSKHQRVLTILSPLRAEKLYARVFRAVFRQNVFAFPITP